MTKTCLQCKADFTITAADQQLLQSWDIPAPTCCPDCRLQRRLAYRNEKTLYQRQCDLCKKSIISIYAPDKLYTVYCKECWWSDQWTPLTYGQDYDPQRSILDQLNEVYTKVPHIALYTTNCVNSDYNNYGLNLNNCYLLFGASNNENCLYGKFVQSCKDTMDSLSVVSLELCYEAVTTERCYNCRFVTNSRDCHDCLMIEECHSCTNCIGCFGLHAKEYYVFNKFVGKDEYERIKQVYNTLTQTQINQLRQELDRLKATLPQRASHIYSSEQCTGDFILNSMDCLYSFDLKESEHCRYVSNMPLAKDCMDCTFAAPYGLEHCYEVCSNTDLRDSIGTFLVWNGSRDIYYSLECYQSHDLFACVGLSKSAYCILNTQYSKNDYENLKAKIIADMKQRGEWGEFLPPRLSPFGYNETIAQEYFTRTQTQALEQGYNWYEIPPKPNQPQIQAIPENITKVTNTILQTILQCTQCQKNYRIVPPELDLYRRLGVPVPQICPECRRAIRLQLRGPYHLYSRNCSRCQQTVLTNKSEQVAPIVYCEACYQAEIY